MREASEIIAQYRHEITEGQTESVLLGMIALNLLTQIMDLIKFDTIVQFSRSKDVGHFHLVSISGRSIQPGSCRSPSKPAPSTQSYPKHLGTIK